MFDLPYDIRPIFFNFVSQISFPKRTPNFQKHSNRQEYSATLANEAHFLFSKLGSDCCEDRPSEGCYMDVELENRKSNIKHRTSNIKIENIKNSCALNKNSAAGTVFSMPTYVLRKFKIYIQFVRTTKSQPTKNCIENDTNCKLRNRSCYTKKRRLLCFPGAHRRASTCPCLVGQSTTCPLCIHTTPPQNPAIIS